MQVQDLLGRITPPDFNHVEKYPLRASNMPSLPVPIVAGVNWYSNFFNPILDKGTGLYWIGKNPNSLGSVQGGHAVCIPHNNSDLYQWYWYYNQGLEGACVGFSSSRMMSMLNRKTYEARWLWNQAKMIDAWADTNPGDDQGTSVRAAMDVLRDKGHVLSGGTIIRPSEGIITNRWATNIDDLFSVLQNPLYNRLGAIPFHNSWGKDYPKKVFMPCETWQRLMNEYGEFTMVTDR